MMASGNMRGGGRRRLALLLVACALLLRIALPAGWMPQASAHGVTLAWCSGMGDAAPAEAKALIASAVEKRHQPAHKSPGDQPCPFAVAAGPVAHLETAPPFLPVTGTATATHLGLIPFPGRGLVAPPPFATGPPLHA